MAPKNSPRLIRSSTGFTLVELMVGLVIGMLGVLIIMQALTVNESYKRSTGGVGEAQANGAVALFSLEREIRMAGYGITHPSALGCGPVYWYNWGAYSSPPGPAGGALPTVVAAPVLITDGGSTGTDAIQIMYSTSQERSIPVKTLAHPAGADEVMVDNVTGFRLNDLFLIAYGSQCMIFQAANIDDSTNSIIRAHTVQSFTPPPGNSYFYDYVAGADVFNLGRPQVTRYAISGSDLVFTPIISPNAAGGVPEASADPRLLVSGIVDMKAWYGIDNDGNGKVADNEWTKSTPTNATNWLQVRAVRLALLVRSGNFEKPSITGGTCEATTANNPNLLYRDPTIPFNAANPGTQLKAFNNIPEGLPSCYKYRTFETVIPLRNMIWRYDL